jgi:hypothetical protein
LRSPAPGRSRRLLSQNAIVPAPTPFRQTEPLLVGESASGELGAGSLLRPARSRRLQQRAERSHRDESDSDPERGVVLQFVHLDSSRLLRTPVSANNDDLDND